eukprot:6468289-Amphidinium_carterae.2
MCPDFARKASLEDWAKKLQQCEVADYSGHEGGVRLWIQRRQERINYRDESITAVAREGSMQLKNATLKETSVEK